MNVELTPNEFHFAKKNRKLFRLCVVLDVLNKKHRLHVLSHGTRCQTWVGENGRVFDTEERVAAGSVGMLFFIWL